MVLAVDTATAPEHWKTVASLTSYMAGNAVVRAADDLLDQLRANGAQAFGCPPGRIEIGGGQVFSKNPERYFVQGHRPGL